MSTEKEQGVALSQAKHGNNNTVVIGDDRTMALENPGRYIGDITLKPTKKMLVTPQLDKMFEQTINYSAGLFKIVEEIVDNGLDECKRCIAENLQKDGYGTELNVVVYGNGWIEVSDNGRGIPDQKALVQQKIKGQKERVLVDSDYYMTEAAWTQLKTSGNRKEMIDENSTVRGQNGEGAALTNIYSKNFIGTSINGNTMSVLKSWENMDDWEFSRTETTEKHGTKVQFLPDYSRFGVDNYTNEHQYALIYHLAILSLQYPQVKFTYNGIHLQFTYDKLINGFTNGKNVYEKMEVDGLTVIVIPNPETKTDRLFINGSYTSEGGDPLDWVQKSFAGAFKKHLPTKFKDLKDSQVHEHLDYIVFFSKIIKPRFGGAQSKSICTTKYSEFKNSIDTKALDWDNFAKRVFKNKKIYKIMETFFGAQLSAQEKLNIKKGEKERVSTDLIKLYFPAVREKKFLLLAEGNSAVKSIREALSREFIGSFPSGGVPMNCLVKPMGDIAKNVKINTICNKQILNLSFSEKNTSCAYQYVVSTTDADPDGMHIRGLTMGMFYRLYPELIYEGRFLVLDVPVVVATNNKEEVQKYFMNIQEFKDWLEANPDSKLKFEYKKGLGSMSSDEWNDFFSKHPFETLLTPIIMRDPKVDQDGADEDLKMLENWLDSESADFRKEQIRIYHEQLRDLENLGVDVPEESYV